MVTEHPMTNHMLEATEEAVRRARERLQAADLGQAAARGGLERREDGAVIIFLLGRELHVQPGSLEIASPDGKPVTIADQMLVLRYLECEREVRPTGEDITFRNLPGGAFYFGPISNRTTKLLLKVFGNDAARLKAALARYPFDELGLGDVGVKIHAIGRIEIKLIYRQGDEEFPATMDLLYDKCIGTVYTTDEVAALATRMAIGLIRN